MSPPFDIFRVETNGDLLWIASAATFEGAESRIQELAVVSRGEYLVLNQRTGNRHVIKFDDLSEHRRPDRVSAKEGNTP